MCILLNGRRNVEIKYQLSFSLNMLCVLYYIYISNNTNPDMQCSKLKSESEVSQVSDSSRQGNRSLCYTLAGAYKECEISARAGAKQARSQLVKQTKTIEAEDRIYRR